MASITAFAFTIFLTIHLAIAQSSDVRAGSFLTPTGATTSWLSPSGLYAFGFYPQTHGYALGICIAGIPERTVVWTASRETLPLSENATLSFDIDGSLSLDPGQGQQMINIYKTNNGLGASFASMQDSGNFVLYNYYGTRVLWQSFENPTKTILAGQHLVLEQALVSSVSEKDQSIGGGYPTKETIYRMKIDADGILRLYYHDLSSKSKNGSIIFEWSADKCAGKGVCGINGYCMVMNNTARCQCLPGFEFINTELWSLGCKRIYTLESCKVPDARATFWMTSLIDVQWENTAYEIAEASTTQEKCSKACLDDCNCEAALFSGQECRLQKLPLTFVNANQSLSDVGLIKVYSSSAKFGSNPSIRIKKLRQMKILLTSVSLISFAIIVLLFSGVL
uniref:non-specific serine/threonine protein kinase n=1 Tax=Tanacetum cinerariifolium TaxID=118510 RepID=A0A6L2MKA4_TANCI|nr:G-type lectin S-receptor-like serine/threonine-protein kinase LECRK3 [Tanacetum cinerariifolium]